MNRDKHLICKVLRYVSEKENGPLEFPSFSGFSAYQINNHVLLCSDAGYIELTVDNGLIDTPVGLIDRLTWSGHNALEGGLYT